MNGTKITVTDIFGSIHININTPIIILYDVSKEYLIGSGCIIGVYNVDTIKLQRDLESRIPFIDRFIPVGQISLSDDKKKFTLPMANTRIIHVTSNFENINEKYETHRYTWIGITRKNGKRESYFRNHI